MSQHSPLPWKIGSYSDDTIEDSEGNKIVFSSYNKIAEKEDVKFIVKAVNMHDELVEALDEIAKYVYSTVEPFSHKELWEDDGEPNRIMTKVLDLLGKLKEETI